MKLKDQFPTSHRQRGLGVFLSVLLGEILPFLFSSSTILYVCSGTVLLLIMSLKKRNIFLILLCISFLFGNVRSHICIQNAERFETLAKTIVADTAEYSGTVIEASSLENSGSRFIFQIDAPQIKVLVHTIKPTLFFPGDRMVLTGLASVPQNMEEGTFNYVMFLKKDGIFLEIKNAKIIKKLPSTPNILAPLARFNHFLQMRIKELWDGDDGALIAGILIGSRETMSPELKNDFQKTGLSHIVAISGSNITIIIVFIFSLLRVFTKRIQIIIACLMIICFTFFVGASSAVIRASIMGILGLVALLAERKSTAWYTVLLSAVIMSLYNPYVLLYDVGFQLSFLAVLGLLFAGPLVEPFTKHLPTFLQIRESLHMTLCAIVFTTPIMLYYFNSFSLIAPLANILITPWIPLLMLLSFLTLCFSFFIFLYPFTLCLQLATNSITEGMIWLTSYLAHIPYASVVLSPFSTGWGCALSYVILAYNLILLEQRKRKKEENMLSLST